MREYALIKLNTFEYAWIKHLNKYSSECARILNVSDVVNSITPRVQITGQLGRQSHIHNNVKHLRLRVLQKE